MFFFSQDYHIADVCFPHQYPKKREDNKFWLIRLLILVSLVLFFTVLILEKEHQIAKCTIFNVRLCFALVVCHYSLQNKV